MSGFSGIETNNKLDKLKLELEREMLKIVYDSYKNGYEEGALKNAPRAMENLPVAPVPCVKETENTSIKDLFQKLNEEVDELKVEILKNCYFDDGIDDVRSILKSYKMDEDIKAMQRIAEEAADVCTVVTSLLEAIGIGFEMRQEAQRRVNEHNKERGRW